VCPADHLGDPIADVVCDHREVVGPHAIAPAQDGVSERGWIHAPRAPSPIEKRHLSRRQLEPGRALFVTSRPTGSGMYTACVADLTTGAGATVDVVARGGEPGQHGVVLPLRLSRGFAVPAQAQPLEVASLTVFDLVAGPGGVDV